MDWRKIILPGAVGVALVLAGTAAGASIAQGPVSNGQIQACYDSGGNLRVLLPGGTSCPKGYTALDWNVQGQPGQQGGQGPAGPPGPAGGAADSGTVKVTQQGTLDSNGNITGVTDTCSVVSTSGPDASSITVTSVNNMPNPSPLQSPTPISGCDISGLPKGFTFLLFPVNDMCGYGPYNPSGPPIPGGGPGTVCPDYVADNSGELGANPIMGLNVGGDYGSSAQTDLLVTVPPPAAGYYEAGEFNWVAMAPTS
jgi:hypothetical protein